MNGEITLGPFGCPPCDGRISRLRQYLNIDVCQGFPQRNEHFYAYAKAPTESVLPAWEGYLIAKIGGGITWGNV